VLYGSTHEASPACPPPADRSKGYVWAVYPGYDIFVADLNGKITRRLTEASGYDAEGTVNWKTGKIVYTSMASVTLCGHERGKDRKQQITKTEGYDGELSFRATDPNRVAGESSAGDGCRDIESCKRKPHYSHEKRSFLPAKWWNTRRLTNFGCASFAYSLGWDQDRLLEQMVTGAGLSFT
jgi:hypothetical protein